MPLLVETKLRIAQVHGKRRFRAFWCLFPRDAEQTAWVIALSRPGKHDTVREFQRVAGRLWYRAAREYGLMRRYQRGAGNQKSGWFWDQQQEKDDDKTFDRQMGR